MIISNIFQNADNVIGNLVYPAEDTNKNHTSTHVGLLSNFFMKIKFKAIINLQNRNPVSYYKQCDNTTELLYPGDNEGDWV